MADLPETSEWIPGIYQLETSDPVLGGPEGIDNLQAKQLASRTAWLKAQLQQLGTDKQASDATLSALAALAFEANQIVYSTGPDAFALATLTPFIRMLLDDPDATVARATLGAAALNSPIFTGTPSVPTPNRFAVSQQAVNAEFVSDAMGGLRRTIYSLTPAQVITPAMVNSLLYAGAGTTTATLPLLASVPVGSTLTFAAMSSPITLSRQGADTIWVTSVNPTITSIAIGLGDSLTLVAAPFGWVCAGGSAMFAYQGATGCFAATLALNGSQKLPSGRIEQWGTVSVPSGYVPGTKIDVTLPYAFPNSVLSVKASGASNGSAAQSTTGATFLSKSQIQVWSFSDTGTTSIHWSAIGS